MYKSSGLQLCAFRLNSVLELKHFLKACDFDDSCCIILSSDFQMSIVLYNDFNFFTSYNYSKSYCGRMKLDLVSAYHILLSHTLIGSWKYEF